MPFLHRIPILLESRESLSRRSCRPVRINIITIIIITIFLTEAVPLLLFQSIRQPLLRKMLPVFGPLPVAP